jgi:hypothetical protein
MSYWPHALEVIITVGRKVPKIIAPQPSSFFVMASPEALMTFSECWDYLMKEKS